MYLLPDLGYEETVAFIKAHPDTFTKWALQHIPKNGIPSSVTDLGRKVSKRPALPIELSHNPPPQTIETVGLPTMGFFDIGEPFELDLNSRLSQCDVQVMEIGPNGLAIERRNSDLKLERFIGAIRTYFDFDHVEDISTTMEDQKNDNKVRKGMRVERIIKPKVDGGQYSKEYPNGHFNIFLDETLPKETPNLYRVYLPGSDETTLASSYNMHGVQARMKSDNEADSTKLVRDPNLRFPNKLTQIGYRKVLRLKL